MACIGSSTRLCARVQEKLCHLGQSSQARRKASSYVKSHKSHLEYARTLHAQDSPKNVSSTITAAPSCSPLGSSSGTTVSGMFSQHPCFRNNWTISSDISKRCMSTMRTQQTSSLPEYQVHPYHLIEDDLKEVYDDIKLIIRKNTNNEELHSVATYYFDGQGKAFRPMVITLMSRAINHHLQYKDKRGLLQSQKEVAMIAEMIHSASLMHDDVIDQADIRRGKPSANVLWNHKKVTMAGDFILAVASMMIGRLRNDDVTLCLSKVITDLIQGEFMQLGSKETENERFAHYLTKTYRKTASLIANSLKSVAILAGADEQICEIAFQYGRNLGLAFQLVDDLLDFVSSAEEMGKPAAADLKLGLATAPVLFACEKYPELTPMIMRRFQEPGDCERAFDLVHKSQGLKQTQFLAQQHCMEAARLSNTLAQSPHSKALVVLTDFVLNRMK